MLFETEVYPSANGRNGREKTAISCYRIEGVNIMSLSSISGIRSLALFASLVCLTTAQAQSPTDHTSTVQLHTPHQHADHLTLELEMNNGQRWETDGPLREGMERIRDAFNETDHHLKIHDGLDNERRETLATTINNGIAYMVTHCSLESRADANLHILLGRLAEAAVMMKEEHTARQGLTQIQEILERYTQFFEHPGW
jgi:hypothetical protein